MCGGHSAPNFGHIFIFTGRVPFIYIVIRAMWSTVLGGECGVIWGVLVGVWLGDLGGCPGCVLGWGLGWGSCSQLVSWLADLYHL